MKKIILTSTGFDNKNIEVIFKKMICKDIQEIKVLFIPRAALHSNKIEYIELCRAELISLGVLECNIHRNDLNNEITKEEVINYDVIYVTGGVTKYLVEYMEKHNFRDTLNHFLDNNGIYLGVSAGSLALSSHQSEKLGFFKSKLEVHSDIGTKSGEFVDETNNIIKLTDNQALLILDDVYKVIE